MEQRPQKFRRSISETNMMFFGLRLVLEEDATLGAVCGQMRSEFL